MEYTEGNMGLFAEIFSNFIYKNKYINADEKTNFIFYKIVDFVNESYVLQCINTNAIFHARIMDIVFDVDILYGLHPIQASYIGIEYANYIKKITCPTSKTSKEYDFKKYSTNRYGLYNIYYQSRRGELCFINVATEEKYIMDPRDIVLSEQLIGEFDAAQAFYIGLLAGFKINKKRENENRKIYPYLKIIK